MGCLHHLAVLAALLGVLSGCSQMGGSSSWKELVPTREHGEIVLQLTPEQRRQAASATYSVIARSGSGYVPLLTDAPLQIDGEGRLHLPEDPQVLVAVDTADDSHVPISARCASDSDEETVYESDGLWLAMTQEMTPYDKTKLVVKHAHADDSFVASMERLAPYYPLKKEVKDDEMPLYRALRSNFGEAVCPVRTDDGAVAPFDEWAALSSSSNNVSLRWTLHDKPLFELAPASLLFSEGSLNDWSVQICVTDTSGTRHASEVIEVDGSDFEGPAEPLTVETAGGTLTFKPTGDGVAVSGYSGEDDTVEIPAEVEGKPVTAVLDRAFEGAYVAELVLPDSVTSIGDRAFKGSSIIRVNIPAGLKRLGHAPFFGAFSFEEFVQDEPNGLTSVQDGVLFSEDGTTLLAYPIARRADTYEVPEGVETIAYGAFASAKLTQVQLPSTLKEIEALAFCDCTKLQSLELPEGLERIEMEAFGSIDPMWAVGEPTFDVRIGSKVSMIGRGAFSGLNVRAIEVAEDNPWYKSAGGHLLSADNVLLQVPAAKAAYVSVPKGVTALAEGAVYDVHGYDPEDKDVHVFLPASVQAIEEGALPTRVGGDEFSSMGHVSCAAYLHVRKGSWAESYAQENKIPYDHIRNAKGLRFHEVALSENKCDLTFRVYPEHAQLIAIDAHDAGHVAIPSEVESVPVTVVGSGDQDKATGTVITVVLPPTLERVQGRLLTQLSSTERFEMEGNDYYCIKNGALYTADGTVLVAYPHNYGESYVVPEGTREIGDGAFYYAELQSVTLPEGLERIGAEAFTYCSNLKDVAFPQSLKSIGEKAFYLSGLTSVHLNEGLETIGQQAFYAVESCEGLQLPDSVTTVGSSAFRKSYDELMGIGQSALSIGSGLERVEFEALAGLDIESFTVAEDNKSFVAEGPLLLSKDKKTLVACAGGVKGELRIPEGVESIQDDALHMLPNVTDIYIPGTLFSLEEDYTLRSRVDAGTLVVHCPAGTEAARVLEENNITYEATEEAGS